MTKLRKRELNIDGFSLIELVVAVGILAILSVVGVVAYSNITENARKTAVQAAAAEVYTGAVAYDANSNDPNDYKKAADEWNASSKKGNGSITVSATKPNGVDICATATMGEPHNITASKGAGCPTEGVAEPGDGGATETPTTPEPTVPPIPAENHFINADTRWGKGGPISNEKFDSFGRTISYTSDMQKTGDVLEYNFNGTIYLNRSQFQQPVDFKQNSYTITVQSTNGQPMVLDVANSYLGNYKYQGTVGVAAVKHTFVVNNPSEVERYKLHFKFPNVKVGSAADSSSKATLTYDIAGNTCFKSGCSITLNGR